MVGNKATHSRFTVMIVPQGSSPKVRKFTITRGMMLTILILGLAVMASTTVMGAHYFQMRDKLRENTVLRERNFELTGRIHSFENQLADLNGTLDRIQRFDSKLRAMTSLNDPERRIAMGPVGDAAGKQLPNNGDEINPTIQNKRPEELLDKQEDAIKTLGKNALTIENRLRMLEAYLGTQQTLLASTPSILPARGWITSGFGRRVDPYTGQVTMHSGLDVAGAIGTPVYSSADGVVMYSDYNSGYGKMIAIDHGFGVMTRYAHLSMIRVNVGDKVKRGDHIGDLGNTGRSTGPHLHYEVEVNGVPVNPQMYILDADE